MTSTPWSFSAWRTISAPFMVRVSVGVCRVADMDLPRLRHAARAFAKARRGAEGYAPCCAASTPAMKKREDFRRLTFLKLRIDVHSRMDDMREARVGQPVVTEPGRLALGVLPGVQHR